MKTGLTIILDVAGWALILLSIAFAFITMLFFPAEKYTLEQLLFASINVLLGGIIIGSALLVISNTNKTLHKFLKNVHGSNVYGIMSQVDSDDITASSLEEVNYSPSSGSRLS